MDSVETSSDVGQVIVMSTNGGPHSPEFWGQVTTDKLMDLVVVEPTASLEILNDVLKFQENVLGCMIAKHDQVAKRERAHLASLGASYLSEPIDPSDFANQALAETLGAAGESVLRDHFARRDVQDIVYQTTGQHFADNAHIERCWFAQGLPDDPAAQSYLNQLNIVSMPAPSTATEALKATPIF